MKPGYEIVHNIQGEAIGDNDLTKCFIYNYPFINLIQMTYRESNYWVGGDDLSQHLVAVLKIRSLKPKS